MHSSDSGGEGEGNGKGGSVVGVAQEDAGAPSLSCMQGSVSVFCESVESLCTSVLALYAICVHLAEEEERAGERWAGLSARAAEPQSQLAARCGNDELRRSR